MKRLFLTLLIATSLVGAIARQATADTPAEAELIALVDAWIDAEVDGDRSALERILDERFLSTWASGTTIDRTAYINYIMATKIAPFRVEHQKIRVHGDTAVVIDVSQSGKTKFTWIAVKRDGQWRVISQTLSSVESPR